MRKNTLVCIYAFCILLNIDSTFDIFEVFVFKLIYYFTFSDQFPHQIKPDRTHIHSLQVKILQRSFSAFIVEHVSLERTQILCRSYSAHSLHSRRVQYIYEFIYSTLINQNELVTDTFAT